MRVALTGAATGIGAALQAKLIAAGHDVTSFDIAAPAGADAHWIETDLSDPASIAAALAAAEGPFDALINNAGLPPRSGTAAQVLAVNFIGFRAFLEGMCAKLAPGAAIVNTASRAGAGWRDNLEEVRALLAVAGAEALPAFVAAHGVGDVRAYNLSKEAVIVYTMASTAEMTARGFRMNSVSPAAVSTGILDDFVAAFGDRVAKNLKLSGRAGTPEEIADVILFLASPESRWIKGNDIVIDGGMSAMLQAQALEL